MQHPDEGTIHSWLDGALSADEAARVEAHVKECPQCAATVAEARGFIAGASRILTALDNAPRGVIPAAATKKRIDPWVWRVAATVLVVAAGTLVVLRENGSEPRTDTINAETNALNAAAPTAKTVGPMAPVADEAMRTSAEQPPLQGVREKSSSKAAAIDSSRSSADLTEKRAASDTSTAAQPLAAAPLADYSRATSPRANRVSGSRTAPAAQSNLQPQENKAAMGQVSGATVEKISSASGNVDSVAPILRSPTTIVLRGASSLSDASQQPPLKVVGTPRTLGAKVTLYEVAPGDTVTLTEPIATYLESVVTTGFSTARQAPRQTAGKAATTPGKRPDTVVASAPAPQSAGASVAAAPPKPSAPTSSTPMRSTSTPSTPAPVASAEVANGVTTITWTDPATGNVLKLSGRISEAWLRQIKIRIEQERAAARAKKNP